MNCLFNYDKAIYDKIHSLYDEVIFASPDEVFKQNAKNHKGKVMMPFIGVYRLPDFSVNRAMYNDSYVRRGDNRFRARPGQNVEFPNQNIDMHGIPVTLQYQIDIYATKRDVCDGLASEIVLEMFENPWVNVLQTGMGKDFVQQFNVDIDDSIVDNTSITEFDETNRFYRLTVTIEMQEAVIYRYDRSANPIKKFEMDFNFEDGRVGYSGKEHLDLGEDISDESD